MKKLLIILLLSCPLWSRAQSITDCLQQLALDYQKLSGLKSILSQMYKGYELVTKGYHAVQNVSKGNFNLHEAFLDGLYVVSPTVRKYPKVARTITNQTSLISEYRSAWGNFRQNKNLSPDELGYMLEVYNNLVSQSLNNLDALVMVMSDSKLRMSDAERLRSVDRLYTESSEELAFLRKFNDQVQRTAGQRARQSADHQTVNRLYGLN